MESDDVVQCNSDRRWSAVVASGGLPVGGSASLSIGLGLETVGNSGGSEPRESSRGPHLLFMALRDRGPPAICWAGLPRSGSSQGPGWPLGQPVEIKLTFSPLISSYVS
jgi:hypothetical protein